MNLSLVEKKPHGLLFGGFTCTRQERYAERLNTDSPVIDPDIESYRSFGNHRIATHIRKTGWDVEVIDYGIFFTNDELADILAKRVTEDTVFIGFSMMFVTVAIDKLRWLTDHIRENYPWVKIISGGQKTWTVTHVEADYYITGNGEYAMDALLKYLVSGTPEPKVTKTFDNGGQLITAQHSYPCFPKRDAAISFEDRDFLQPNETVNIEFARGCIFACKYCSFPLLGMKQDTTRDEDSVYEELLENYEKWGITNYYVTDDTINDSKDKMALLARAVRRLPFQPQFSGYVRADLLIRHGKETWDDMIDMGLTSHAYGVETFNYQSGKTVGKGMKPEEMRKGLLEIQDYFRERSPNYYAGLLSMIAGLPYETFESLEESKQWLKENWSGHCIAYLPLMLSEPDDEQADEIDWKVYNNFMEYGYTYSYDEPEFFNEDVKRQFQGMKKVKGANKNRKNNKWNFWIHPSGDYDFIDMIEWTNEFRKDRSESGMNPAGPWQTNYVHAVTYKNPKDAQKYHCENAESIPVIGMINIIRDYKQNKLDVQWKKN